LRSCTKCKTVHHRDDKIWPVPDTEEDLGTKEFSNELKAALMTGIETFYQKNNLTIPIEVDPETMDFGIECGKLVFVTCIHYVEKLNNQEVTKKFEGMDSTFQETLSELIQNYINTEPTESDA